MSYISFPWDSDATDHRIAAMLDAASKPTSASKYAGVEGCTLSSVLCFPPCLVKSSKRLLPLPPKTTARPPPGYCICTCACKSRRSSLLSGAACHTDLCAKFWIAGLQDRGFVVLSVESLQYLPCHHITHTAGRHSILQGCRWACSWSLHWTTSLQRPV